MDGRGFQLETYAEPALSSRYCESCRKEGKTMSADDWNSGSYAATIREKHYHPYMTCPICGKSCKGVCCRLCGIVGCEKCVTVRIVWIGRIGYPVCTLHTDSEAIEYIARQDKEEEERKNKNSGDATLSPYYGSENQLKWAKDIKKRFDMLRGDSKESLPDIPYAKFWIDNRNKTYAQLIEGTKSHQWR